MAEKTYYIVESKSGALDVTGSQRRMDGTFTNKAESKSVLKELRRLNKNNSIIYWISFDRIKKKNTEKYENTAADDYLDYLHDRW